MIGSQKSSKINSLKDQYSRVIYNRHELYDMLYDGEDISAVTDVDWHEDFEKYNTALELNHDNSNRFSPIEKLVKTIEDFDYDNQSNWFMPQEYKELDVYSFIMNKCSDEPSVLDRVKQELTEFESRGMTNLLRYMIYLVDHMRKNGIVWGVGRGSSVASYVLYIIGIHRINSIQYNLDYKEFLR